MQNQLCKYVEGTQEMQSFMCAFIPRGDWIISIQEGHIIYILLNTALYYVK